MQRRCRKCGIVGGGTVIWPAPDLCPRCAIKGEETVTEPESDLLQQLIADYRKGHGGGSAEDFVEWARMILVKHPPKGASSDPDGKIQLILPDGRSCPLSSHGATKADDTTKPACGTNLYQRVF
jgi:hypothetical protein